MHTIMRLQCSTLISKVIKIATSIFFNYVINLDPTSWGYCPISGENASRDIIACIGRLMREHFIISLPIRFLPHALVPLLPCI